MAEDIKVGKAVGNGFIEPMKKSWEQGKPVEAITQGVLACIIHDVNEELQDLPKSENKVCL
jgi:hypothetical protein